MSARNAYQQRRVSQEARNARVGQAEREREQNEQRRNEQEGRQ